MFRLVVTGKSIKELAENAQKFIAEASAEKTKSSPQIQINSEGQLQAVTETPVTFTPATPPVVAPPILAPPAPAVNLGNGEKDSRGIPWDERIHSASAAKNKDGSWRSRRGVEPAVLKQIEEQLRSAVQPAFTPPPVPASAPVQQQAVVPPVVPAAPVAASPVAFPPTFGIPPQAVAPVAPPVLTIAGPPPLPPMQPTIAAHTFETFNANMPIVLAQMVKDGKLTQEYMKTVCDHFKVEYIWQASDDQKREMFEQFVAAGLLAKV